ncbi:MAG: transaldolase [Chloroflexi bacterium]|nr:transaldolase [Chloroflexota bacterium]
MDGIPKRTPALDIYLDSADPAAWEHWLPTGLFVGLTTNPLLLQRANIPCTVSSLKELARRGFDLGAQRIHMQVWGGSADEMCGVGQQLAAFAAAIDGNIVVKVPLTREGAICARRLIQKKVPVTLTAVYAVHQVITALALGANFAAPYLGRMTEAGQDGRADVLAMHNLCTQHPHALRLLVASIRQVEDLLFLVEHGLRDFTISPALADALFADPLTLQAARDFEQAARAMGAE